MESVKILGLTVVSAIVYGILHDMVTANVCVEYFSVFHPDLFHTDSPWLLALGWGVVATWWMGLFLGGLVVAAARSGKLPKLAWGQLVLPVLTVLAFSAVCSFVSGSIGYNLVVNIPEWVFKMAPDLRHLSPQKQQAFTGDLFAHNASYIASAIGSLLLCVWIIRTRLRLPRPMIAGVPPF